MNYKHFIVALAAGLLILTGLFAGCSDDEADELPTGPGSAIISVDDIIFIPKSPAPGDTLQATAVVTVNVVNPGEYATYKWTANGGTFLEDNRSSVRWVAPINSSVYNLSVTASLSSSSSDLDANVFVGVLQDFIDERAGDLYPTPTANEIYYLSGPAQPDSGVVVRFKDADSDIEVFPGTKAGTDFSFDTAVTQGAHMHLTPFPMRITIRRDDLGAGTQEIIAIDERTLVVRPNEYSAPYVSPDGQMIVYQGALLDEVPPVAGGVDTFSVYLYETASGSTQRATYETRSFYPTISPNNSHVVFVSDKGGSLLWELYALPIDGTTVTPDTVPNALVKLTDTGGVLGGESIPPSDIIKEWNPNSALPLLAVVGTDERLRIANTDGSPSILVNVSGNVTDIKWSADGQSLAASVFDSGVNSIYIVSTGGDPTKILDGLGGDRFSSLSWSPDGAFLVYMVTRGTNVWYELFDPTGASGQTAPVRVTPAMIPGDAVDFGPPLNSFRPVWAPGSRTVYLFMLDGSTPRVQSLDLSGVGE
jgi:WD40 repeat protein